MHSLAVKPKLILQLQKLIYVLNLRSLLYLIEYLLRELIVVVEVVDLLRNHLGLNVKLILLWLPIVQKLRIAQVYLELVPHLVP